MQCFICMTYMLFIYSARTGTSRDLPITPERRSLFRDVIESLRIRSQIPEEYNQNEENNLAQPYDNFGYENEFPQLPGDSNFIPRRNDRIEMPSLRYRFPKSLPINDSYDETNDSPKEEIIVYIDTTKEPKTSTQKPKKQKRPVRPTTVKNKPNKKDEDVDESETQKPEEYIPWSNTMGGQSQIGNRDSQMVVKPTVIVNIRGSVTHRDSDIRIEGRTKNDTRKNLDMPQNIFNINQEIKLERNFAGMGSNGGQKIVPNSVKQDVKITSEKEKGKIDEDMMMCETATWNPEKNREDRKFDNVFQIMFSL